MKTKLVSLLSLLFIILVCSVTTVFAESQKITLSKVKGIIEIIPAGQTEGDVGIEGLTLQEGDAIQTYDNGRAEVTFEDGSTISLKKDSFLIIQEATKDGKDSTTITKLDYGELKAKVEKLTANSVFKTVTPVAVAAVRGTTYIVRVTIDGKTTVYVVEGMMNLTSLLTGLGVTINEGKFSIVDPTGKITDPAPDTEFVDITLESDDDDDDDDVDSRNVQSKELEKQKRASPA